MKNIIRKNLFLLAMLLQAASVYGASEDAARAYQLYEKHDMLSLQQAMNVLEAGLQKNQQDLDAQALIGLVYANYAYQMNQAGGNSSEYLSAAESFAGAVLKVAPGNMTATKSMAVISLVKNNRAEAIKNIEVVLSKNPNEADGWYFYACASEAKDVEKRLEKSITLDPKLAWAYGDLAMRSLELKDISGAEKWVGELEKNRNDVAELSMYRGFIAVHKNNNAEAKKYFLEFAGKIPDSPVAIYLKRYAELK